MNLGVLTLVPVALAVVLVVSGVSKIGRTGQTRAAMQALRLPVVSDSRFVAASVPWAELVVAAGLVLAPGWGFAVASWLVVAVMAVFTALVAGVLLRGDADVDCNCFGSFSTEPVGPATFGRNLVLLAASLVVAFGAAGDSGVIANLASFDSEELTWFVVVGGLLVALAVIWVSGQRRASRAIGVADPAGVTGDVDDDDRSRIAAESELVDSRGVTHNLRELTAGRALLVYFVKPGCHLCGEVVDALPRWSRDVGSLVDTVVATSAAPDDLYVAYPGLRASRVLFGQKSAAAALGVEGTPAAVLLDRDGRPAAGPAYGVENIGTLVGGIVEALSA